MQIQRPIITALIVMVTIALIYFLVMPKFNEFNALRVTIGEKKAEYLVKNEYYSEVKKAYDDLYARPEAIKKIGDALPTDESYGKLIYFLQKKTTASGLILKDLSLSRSSSQTAPKNASNQKKTVKELVFSLSLTGSYASLGNFMHALEKSGRIFEITSISFSSDSGSRPTSSSTSSSSAQSQTQFQSQQLYSFSVEVKTFSY